MSMQTLKKMLPGNWYRIIANLCTGFLLAACQTSDKPPLQTVEMVDIQKFMGPWYVIANIPTFVEKGAHNAIEEYILRPDGDIDVKFTFNKDAFDGPKKEMNPKGFIYDRTTNAFWGMQFIWPFKADYLIIGLAEDYSWTVVGVPSRSYVWIMARSPTLSDTIYDQIVTDLRDKHQYDISILQKIPQKW